MCLALGYRVIDLQRIRIMDLQLGDLPAKKCQKVGWVEQSDTEHPIQRTIKNWLIGKNRHVIKPVVGIQLILHG